MFRAKLDRTVTKFIWANFKAAIVQKIIVQIFMKKVFISIIGKL